MLSWDSDSSRLIEPSDKSAISVQCLGKVGCTSATIHISYGLVNRHLENEASIPTHFHVRQLSFPVMVTVYQMLECLNMNILSLSDSMGADKTQLDPSHNCLFSIEIRNLYGQPFEVTFDRMEDDSADHTTSAVVPPGATTRVVIPLRKFRLPSDKIAQPIPTLSERQFVVAKSKLSKDEETRQRELFWYREELFKRVQSRWKEVGGMRHGNLSLRQQRLSLPMLDALRTQRCPVRLQMVEIKSGNLAEKVSPDIYTAPTHQFIQLQAQVTNTTDETLALSMDLAITPAEHVLYQGVLNDQPLGRVKAGSVLSINMPLCFVARGRFAITGRVRLVESNGELVGNHHIACLASPSKT